MEEYDALINNLVTIASEAFRFESVFSKVLGKLDLEDQNKYKSQYAWFYKKVQKALTNSGLRIINLEGQLYDPGMAITPMNLEEFELDDKLYIAQMVEPIIMKNDTVMKEGTVILGKVEE